MEGKKIDLKDYDQIKEKYQRLILTESQLNNELDSVLSQSNKIINQLATIDASIEKKLEEIEMAKKTENLINEDKLHQKCKDIIDKFLIDVSQREVGVELQIRMQYNQMKISKTITDDNMTFAKLKEETKVQFGKDANEFFFCDESGSIFLDELKVVKALFPLSSAKIEKYIPVILVKDKAQYKKKKQKEFIENEEIPFEKKENTFSLKEEIGKYFKQNAIQFYFSIIFIIFLGMWTQSCIVFLKANDYRVSNGIINNNYFFNIGGYKVFYFFIFLG